ncbi:MAG: glycosyltransferase family 2 protein [Gemmatimonadota bacterium]|nr:glycosyltransferase family 2 protein [Gemmatimonadota bacterium]
MKLLIQIPCRNEEDTLPTTLAQLPRSLPGVGRVEWLIVDDGSTDRTVEVARAAGVDHVVSFPTHQGLARAFAAGLEACVAAGADIVVNTDADNQYEAACIPDLIAPILAGRAEIVVGARPIDEIRDFSPVKKLLQKLGSWSVRQASGTRVADSPSGFRAFTREAALRLNVFSEYTYTLETVIQAGQKNIPITSVPIRTNPSVRPSRLVRSVPSYVRRSIGTIARIFMLYRPLRFFFWAGLLPVGGGVALGVRWLALFFLEDAQRTRAPSLILAAVLLLAGFQLWTFGLVADLMAANRVLLEDVQLRLRRSEAERTRGGAGR